LDYNKRLLAISSIMVFASGNNSIVITVAIKNYFSSITKIYYMLYKYMFITFIILVYQFLFE